MQSAGQLDVARAHAVGRPVLEDAVVRPAFHDAQALLDLAGLQPGGKLAGGDGSLGGRREQQTQDHGATDPGCRQPHRPVRARKSPHIIPLF